MTIRARKDAYVQKVRDGVSCTVCHQAIDTGKPIQDIVTGNFEVSKPGQFGPDELPGRRRRERQAAPVGVLQGAQPEGLRARLQAVRASQGNVLGDAPFLDGTGTDTGTDIITYRVDLPQDLVAGGTVAATLHYQAIPPGYLMQRFTTANGKDTQRLHSLASHLNLEGTAIENWKLPVAWASALAGAVACG